MAAPTFGSLDIRGLVHGTGINIRSPVRVATTIAGTLSFSFTNGSTIDGVTLATGNRILIKNQTNPAENGIYVVQASGAPVRAEDFSPGLSVAGFSVLIREGTINRMTEYMITSAPGSDIVGANGINVQRSAGIGAAALSGSATDNSLVRFDGTTGLIQGSPITVDDTGNFSGVGAIVLDRPTNDLTLGAADQTSAPATATIPNLAGASQNFTMVNLAQTLSNKTLSAPIVTGDIIFDKATNDLTLVINDQLTGAATLTVPSLGGVSQSIVVTALAQTLTNKTLADPTITYAGATAGQVLISDAFGVITPQTPSGGAIFPLRGPDGTATAPSYSFSNDNGLGLFRAGANVLGVSAGGSERLRIDDTAFQNQSGTALLPSYSFITDPNTGILNSAADTLGFSTGGTQRLTLNTTSFASTLPITIPQGTANAPSLNFTADATTGIFSSTGSTINVATAGVNRLAISTTDITPTLPFLAPQSGVPYAFVGDQQTGMASTSAGTLALFTNGAQTLTLDSSSVTSSPRIYAPVGTAPLPSYSFTGRTNTGMFCSGPSTLGFSAGGSQRLTLDGARFSSSVFVTIPQGTASTPSLSFTSDLSTGIFSSAGFTVAVATVGVNRLAISPSNITATLPILAPLGSASAPSFSFAGDTGTGMFRPVLPNILGFSTGGSQRLTLDSTALSSTVPILLPTGTTQLNPSLSFSGDTNTGIYSPGADIISFATGGLQKASIGNVAITANVVVNLPDGAPTNASLGWSTELGGLGFFKSASQTIGITSAGTLRATISSLAIESTIPVRLPAGLVTNCALSFVGDLNTGLYSPGADTIGIATGGAQRMLLSTTSISSTLPISVPNGTAGVPSINFASDLTTGIFRSAASTLAISTAGVERMAISNVAAAFTLPVFLPIASPTAPSLVLNTLDIDTGFYQATSSIDTISASCGGIRSMHLAATNTSLGTGAGTNITTAAQSITIGNSAGLTITNNDGNICIGTFSDVGAGVTNATALGRGALAGISEGVFFRSSLSALTSGGSVVTMLFDTGTGQVGPTASSIRYKENVTLAPRDEAKPQELSHFDQIRVVEYTQKSDDTETPQIGLIAEELVEHVHPSIVPCDRNGDPISVRYELLVCTLIIEVQELRKRVAILEGKPLPRIPDYTPVVEEDLYPSEKQFTEQLAKQKTENRNFKLDREADRIFKQINAGGDKDSLTNGLDNAIVSRVDALIAQRK